ncbi:MAG TPA: cytochrome c [Allosphingosinicella sp.]
MLITIFTGAYNVAASAPHTGLGNWILETNMKNSVAARAADIEAPTRFTEANVMAGAEHYKSMCEQCHGGPGTQRAEFARGLRPRPPELGPELEHWTPSEVFWIVKYGIKMTGMPSFGASHSDEEIWNIVAFVERLPAMRPGQYRAFPEGAGGGSEGSRSHTH